MYNSKLYSILEQFNKYEQNRCRKYIQSPYFNKSQDLIDLYEIFIKRLNSSSQKSFTKELIWRKLSPKRPFDDVRFRKYCSDLLKLVEGFLSQETYESNKLEQAVNLMDAIGKKKLEKLYNSTVKNAQLVSQKQPYRNADYYLRQYQIEKKYYILTEYETKRAVRTNVEDIANNLDFFYFAEKLRLYYVVLTQQTFVSRDYELLFIDEILKNIEKIQFQDIIPISIYYQIILVTRNNENLEHYYKLKKLLGEHSLSFPQKEVLTIYYSAINYCIRQLNQGNRQFLEESFDLYNDLIEKEIIYVNDELSPWDFKNICVLALRLGKYDWAENFIQKSKTKLPEANRENAVTFNLARLYWYQKKHEKVIELLREVEYEDITYNLGSKSMLIATYYETDEIEPLYSLLESFRAYLNRHKDIPESRRRNYKNLIKYTKRLAKLYSGDKESIKKLKEEIKNTKNIADAKWLLEKIAELE